MRWPCRPTARSTYDGPAPAGPREAEGLGAAVAKEMLDEGAADLLGETGAMTPTRGAAP